MRKSRKQIDCEENENNNLNAQEAKHSVKV